MDREPYVLMRERNRRPKIAFLVVNVEICGSPKQHDTFRKNVKKKSNVGELAKKKTTSTLTAKQI